MKKGLLLAAVMGIALCGCSMVPSSLGSAMIQVDKEAVTATNAPAKRMGQACGFNLLGIIAAGDLSVEKAKRNGGIQTVSSVDKRIQSFFGVYSHVCTVVTGE